MMTDILLQQFPHVKHYQRLILLIYFHQKYSKFLKTTVYFVKLFLDFLRTRKPCLCIAYVYFFFLGYHELGCSFALAFAIFDKGVIHILWKREKVKKTFRLKMLICIHYTKINGEKLLLQGNLAVFF